MYAIIEDSGTQIRVRPGDVLELDLREWSEDQPAVTFDRVLLVGGEDDDAARIGRPYVDGATVDGEILEEVKGPKIDVIKFKRRKGHRTKQGHRQRLLKVRINSINAG